MELPRDLPEEEVRGVIALTREQVVLGAAQKPTLSRLLATGAEIVTGARGLDPQLRLYPLGTARALALVLRQSAGTR